MNDWTTVIKGEGGGIIMLNPGQIGLEGPDGKPVRKTKMTHPYSYDAFVIFLHDEPKVANGTIYSDRLLMWDFDKHDKLCQKHFGNRGQYWNHREPEKVEAFLRDWCEDEELVLVRVSEYCNVSNGFPLWRFDYYQKEKS
jgi:hypothetical protein